MLLVSLFSVKFLVKSRSKFRFVKVSFGGHTVNLGKRRSVIGNVLSVVLTGLWAQFWTEW